jgi:hypothetical protein
LQSIRNGMELSLVLDKMKDEMKLARIYHKKAKFSCFSDNIFTFVYSDHCTMYEFNIICDDTIFDKMTIKDLLELKRIRYIDNGIYEKNTRQKLGGISYCKN